MAGSIASMISSMRTKVIYLLALLAAYLLTSCRTSKKVERMEAKAITYEQRTTQTVSLDSLQRWLTGRLLVTEVHYSNPDSTGAQTVAKVVTKDISFAAGEELAREVKSESSEEVKSSKEVKREDKKETKSRMSDLVCRYGFILLVIVAIFVAYKLNIKRRRKI